MRALILVCLALFVAMSCSQKPEQAQVSSYPPTQKVDQVDTVSGVAIADPYRWLENDTAKETGAWVAAQNEVTFGYLKHIPFRDAIRKRLDEVQNYERLTSPVKRGEYYYYSKNSGLQNHNVQYRRKGENGAEELFLDPNAFSTDGTIALSGMSFTSDGSMVALSIQESGSDFRKAVVLKAIDKTVIGDTLKDLKFTGIAWKGNDGFYYSSYGKPEGTQLSGKTQFHKLFYHKLGTPQSADAMIFGGEKTPRRYIGAGLTEDERFLVVSAATSTTGNELYVQDLKNPKGKLVTVVDNFEHNHGVVDNDGSTLIIQTDLDAPNNRIIAVDFSKPGVENWKDIIPENEYAMQGVGTAGKKLFINYLKDASTLVRQFDYKGALERDVELPGIGSAFGFNGFIPDKEVYYSFASFTTPTSIYKYDIATGKSTLFASPKVDFDSDLYETKQVFYTSKDGTKVPMFIVHKKGIELNGKNPT